MPFNQIIVFVAVLRLTSQKVPRRLNKGIEIIWLIVLTANQRHQRRDLAELQPGALALFVHLHVVKFSLCVVVVIFLLP